MCGCDELRRRLGLAPEALGDLGVAREVRVQHLDHDAARELRLLGDVDVGHAAAAQPVDHAVARAGGPAKT